MLSDVGQHWQQVPADQEVSRVAGLVRTVLEGPAEFVGGMERLLDMGPRCCKAAWSGMGYRAVVAHAGFRRVEGILGACASYALAKYALDCSGAAALKRVLESSERLVLVLSQKMTEVEIHASRNLPNIPHTSVITITLPSSLPP